MRPISSKVGFLAVWLCAAPSFAQVRTDSLDATTQPLAAETLAADAASESEVRIKDDESERMTVAVHLADAGPYQFLVDTGSDRTAISRELATTLKLTPGSGARLHSLTGVESVQTAVMPEVKFGRDPVRLQEAPLLERENLGADGILALDSLRSKRVRFDFRNKTMSIVSSSTRLRPQAGDIVVRAKARRGRLLVASAIAGGLPVTIVLDTGAEISVGNEALRRMLSRKQVQSAGRVELTSVTGTRLVGGYAFLDELRLGDIGLSNLAVAFAPAHTFKQLGLEDKPALLLGMNAMRAFDAVTIDFSKKKLRLTLAKGNRRSHPS